MDRVCLRSKNGEHLKIRILSPRAFFLHGVCVPQRRHDPKLMLIQFPKNQLCFLDYQSQHHPSHKILQEHTRMPRSMTGRFFAIFEGAPTYSTHIHKKINDKLFRVPASFGSQGNLRSLSFLFTPHSRKHTYTTYNCEQIKER